MPEVRRGFRERARRFLLREYWNIGVVDQPIADIARHGITRPVRWLPPPPRGTMLADPFCLIHPDGDRTVFAEFLDYRAPRGEIWSARMKPGRDLAEASFAPLLSNGRHMSYPQCVSDDRGTFLVCESWQSGGIPRWRHHDGAWVPLEPLLAGRPAVDPTLFRWHDRWWLFCTFADDGPDARLHLFHAEVPAGPWSPHAANPILVDPAGARPAGPVFMLDGMPVRPAQDCSRTYGGAVMLNAITDLTPASYAERLLRRLDPPSSDYPDGLHTVCPAGEATLIDGKRWGADPRPLGQQALDASCRAWRQVCGRR